MQLRKECFVAVVIAATVGFSNMASAAEFSFSFEWGNIPGCNSGYPNVVSNPIFTFANVPNGTKKLNMHMQDLNVSYDHGGGVITYTGENVIQPGAFEYSSPCPPDGVHTYEWQAKALDAGGGVIGTAKATKDYDGW